VTAARRMLNLRVLARLVQIQRVLIRHGLDDFVRATHLYRPLRFLFFLSPWMWLRRNQDAPRGLRLRLALQELGPIFVKFGQAISTRRDLLPPDIADELASLQDRVPPFEAALARGEDVLFDIDWQGFRQLRARLAGDVAGVFLLPPSLEELARRLEKRGDAPDLIARRMARARDEISHCREFDYVVLNEDFAAALAAVESILAAERLRLARQSWLGPYLEKIGLA
jgi:hypothetical protein